MQYSLALLGIVLLDQSAKHLVKKKLLLEEKSPLIYLWHRENTGFAYGLFAKNQKTVQAVSLGMLAALSALTYQQLHKKNSTKCKLSFILLLAGAVSNVWDRLKNGKVTDYIFIKGKNLPVFNLADLSILMGVLGLLTTDNKNKNPQTKNK